MHGGGSAGDISGSSSRGVGGDDDGSNGDGGGDWLVDSIKLPIATSSVAASLVVVASLAAGGTVGRASKC